MASELVGQVMGILGSTVYEELRQVYGVKSQFQKLKKSLSAINAVLKDAEEQEHNCNTTRNWLANLKNVVYDIEDLFDKISTEGLKRNVRGRRRRCIGRLLAPGIRLYSRYTLTQEVNEICDRLDEIAKNRSHFNLTISQSAPGGNSTGQQEETYSCIRESEVFGREQDKEWIVSHLVRFSRHEEEKFLVIPLFGIGGIGKTTLAKLVYNDARVEADENFKLRFWTHVKKFCPKIVIEDMIQCATGQSCSNWSLQALHENVQRILKGQTFLLVLDNMWDEDLSNWEGLKDVLFNNSRGAIIVTTREERIASFTGTIEPYRVKDLPHDHCWSIFVKYAFKEHEEEAYPLLVQIGHSIVTKCKGVPLAVKTLGSLLHRERDVGTWKKVEGSQLWAIDEGSNGILPALKLSFDHTPCHLRSCFVLCAMFGKGYPLHREDLINVWMAHGLLHDQDWFEDGDRRFDQLLARTFFQIPEHQVIEKYVMMAARVFNWHDDWNDLADSFKGNMIEDVDTIRKHFTDYRGKLPFVEMHDRMHDLAAYVAGEEIATVSSSTRENEIYARAKHLVWDKEDLSHREFPKGLKASKARTFIFSHPMGLLSKSFLKTLLKIFKCLRVLMLCEFDFEELPNSIGELQHLRLLDISLNSKLKKLPNTICKLVNLQLLDFGHCNELDELPKRMHWLVSLTTLVVTSKATCLPKIYFQDWGSLRILSIINCQNLRSLPEGMGELKNLRDFGIESCSRLASLPDDMKQLTGLGELNIAHCEELDLARWEGLSGLINLRSLRLYKIPKMVNFPIGLRSVAGSLQHLRIGECEELRSLPEELGLCTSLLKLQVYDCGKLSKLPVGVQTLKSLQELTIAGCEVLSKRCESDVGDDWVLISHIPYIQTDHQIIQNRGSSSQE